MNGGGSMLDATPPTHGQPGPNGSLLTPVQHNARRISNGEYHASSRNRDTSPQVNGTSQNAPPSPLSPSSDNSQWSSAVGYAATSGKSGRVIEKLMSENDRLKRELKEQIIKGDELQRSMQTFQPQINALKAENENLSHARDVDQTLLTRRDRQIKDLKEDLNIERKKRENLDARLSGLQSERDEAVMDKEREVKACKDREGLASRQAEILEQSFKQFKADTETRVSNVQKEISQLEAKRDRDRQALAKMDVVSDQMRQEFERREKIQETMLAKWSELQDAWNQEMNKIKEETNTENEKTRKLSTEMDQVVKQMRYVMSLKNNTNLDESS
ncbi:hypothetical protein M409DRAFT_17150 [Zasmidium cellare ATCC 36951]|uniref:SWI5-dependent HO expression protein 3 n=1 Tax=Zasmidium cellare ATCC 36951 TaxID=1080233 RepID=A0A6A6D210_ZASCE|nr:uncharacterized protein M409DRAFT_17150 [Zasmidium cellare ATCC 36951]KAF2173205.1 hypothetical protein M409DRAFT_17150 [Zasmidium cellare ATCC 36951]